MDSGFSVSKRILAMREKDVFGQSLMKPRGQGCPVLVPGKDIDEFFEEKPIGNCKTLEQVVDSEVFYSLPEGGKFFHKNNVLSWSSNQS